jgi:hypothetical protein
VTGDCWKFIDVGDTLGVKNFFVDSARVSIGFAPDDMDIALSDVDAETRSLTRIVCGSTFAVEIGFGPDDSEEPIPVGWAAAETAGAG